MINNLKKLKRKFTHENRNKFLKKIINIKFIIQNKFLGNYPLLYFTIWGNSWQPGHPIYSDSDLLIESFPSSGNTFFVYSFLSVNNLKVGHHLHVVAQIKKAIKYEIPIVILIRKPLDAISSRMARRPNLYSSSLIKSYINFYNFVNGLTYDKLLIAKFETYTSNINLVIEAMETQFNISYSLSEDVSGMKNSYFKSAPTKGVKPNKEREIIKIKIQETIEQNPLFKNAVTLYNKIINNKKHIVV